MGFRSFVACLTLAIMAVSGSAHAEESKFDQLIKEKTKVSGLWTLYHTDQQILAEISSAALKKEYIVIPTIAQGISSGSVLNGMPLGDDAIWAFKQSGEKLFVLQRNVRFRADAKSPEADAVELAYSDSVLYALPVLTKSPSGGLLVDVTRVFMNDDLDVGRAIGSGSRLMADRSTWGKIKGFPKNLEIRLNAVYAGVRDQDTVPNKRGVQVAIHYSVSELPSVGSNGYKTRKADDRVGYFLTAIKDFSDKDDPEHFVRYINRWNLQKLDSSLDVSPPKEPIRFYIEKTVPVYLRPTVEAAFLEWNKAFEKCGFANAIRVDLQPTDDDFDPENINYNTFRWITSDAGFAMGPSRVDPRTGQILDADIIFDASFLDSWNSRWEALRSEDIAMMSPKYTPFMRPDVELPKELLHVHRHGQNCTLCTEMQQQMGFAAATLLAAGATENGEVPDELIHQGLKEVVMHEVGHTLGLRHNFKASTWKTLDEINDKEGGLKDGIVASVMDYAPANIAPDPKNQGLYYSQTIGPYDYWAIEYGYKPVSDDELKKIASRAGEPQLDFATDEDTRGFDPDPLTNRFDMGKDPLVFVRRQMEQASDLMPKIVDRTVKDGEGYQRARQAFGLLFRQYWSAALFAARYPGGLYVNRDHKGDDKADAPFVVVEADKQREAMKLLADSAFAGPAIEADQLNFMSVSRWYHWGTSSPTRLDYPIHDDMLNMQDMILYETLYPITLQRILDNEIKVKEGEDAYTLAEHMNMIVDSVFSEWGTAKEDGEYSNRAPLISSFRRNLQRVAITRLGYLISHGLGAPADARTLTRMHLTQLKTKADRLLKNKKVKLDDYSRAHLMNTVAQIDTLLDAELSLPSVN